jgi:hypothetical protein
MLSMPLILAAILALQAAAPSPVPLLFPPPALATSST